MSRDELCVHMYDARDALPDSTLAKLSEMLGMDDTRLAFRIQITQHSIRNEEKVDQ